MFECLQRLQSGHGVTGPIDGLERLGDVFTIPAGCEVHGMADQMDDAGLDDRLGNDGVDRLGKAFQAIDDGNEDVLGAEDARSSRARVTASRRFVFTRSPGRFGTKEGATTSQTRPLTHRCHILETGNDSFRYKASSAAAADARKKKETTHILTSA